MYLDTKKENVRTYHETKRLYEYYKITGVANNVKINNDGLTYVNNDYKVKVVITNSFQKMQWNVYTTYNHIG